MIYLDNAATTWPKPPGVADAMVTCLNEYGANPGRGGHTPSLKAARMVMRVRQQVADFFGTATQADRWIFTSSTTDGANMALFGLLKPGDHVVASSWEHNAIARPLNQLSKQGVAITYVRVALDQELSEDDLRSALRPNTRLIVLSHASNVTGTVQSLEPAASICRELGLALMIDSAQTAGILPLNVEQEGIDILVTAGHKSLYGPPGTGLLYVRPGIELQPWRLGGTGSHSESLEQPSIYPDCLESGTLNTPGIAGLGAGLSFIQRVGSEVIYEHEMVLAHRAVQQLREIENVTVYGWSNRKQVPVVAFNISGCDSTEVSLILDQAYGIATRAGLHCAPLAHKQLGTLEQGVVRLGIGYFNTEAEMDATADAVREIGREMQQKC